MSTKRAASAAAMKIAELERVSGVGRSTLHLYLNAGLLPPAVRRGPKLHLYGSEHVERLRQIKRLKERGLSLAQIRSELSRRALRSAESAAATDARQRAAREDLAKMQEEHGKDARETSTARARVLDTAARLFTEQGYEHVRMSDVATAAGVGKATLYEHFKSKSDLFVACLDRLIENMTAAQSRYMEQEGASLQTDVEQYAAAMIASFGSYRMMISALGAAAFGDDPQLAERARSAFFRLATLFEPLLERAMDAGRIRRMDSQMLTYMTWGALIAVGARLAHGDHRYTLREGLDLYLDFVTHGLKPRDRAAPTRKRP